MPKPVSEKRREQLRASRKRWYQKNGRAYNAKWRKKNLAKVQKYNREHKAKWRKDSRAAMLAAYGGKCKCCGESTPEFLTIDHIKRDGAAHRKSLGYKARSGWYMSEWLRARGYPKRGFRLLCYNCNCGRERNNGVCPHKRRR